jgi:hypothetical protein
MCELAFASPSRVCLEQGTQIPGAATFFVFLGRLQAVKDRFSAADVDKRYAKFAGSRSQL